MKYCANCGTVLDDEAIYCAGCGRQTEEQLLAGGNAASNSLPEPLNVASFTDSSPYAGHRVIWSDGALYIEDSGRVDARFIVDSDRADGVSWPSPEMRTWVYDLWRFEESAGTDATRHLASATPPSPSRGGAAAAAGFAGGVTGAVAAPFVLIGVIILSVLVFFSCIAFFGLAVVMGW